MKRHTKGYDLARSLSDDPDGFYFTPLAHDWLADQQARSEFILIDISHARTLAVVAKAHNEN